MTRKTYEHVLRDAPPHETEAFVDYLRAKNKVEYEDENWIIIRNYKYYQDDRVWLTAFIKSDFECWWMYLGKIAKTFGDWQWMKKHEGAQTVKRPHIHLIKDPHDIIQKVPVLPKATLEADNQASKAQAP